MGKIDKARKWNILINEIVNAYLHNPFKNQNGLKLNSNISYTFKMHQKHIQNWFKVCSYFKFYILKYAWTFMHIYSSILLYLSSFCRRFGTVCLIIIKWHPLRRCRCVIPLPLPPSITLEVSFINGPIKKFGI